MRPFLFFFIIFLGFGCSSEPTSNTDKTESTEDRLGTIYFPVEGTTEAQEHFHKGLLLLHSFEYEDARSAFLEAQAADSTLVMAYWGEAMTHNHPLWRQQEYQEGRAALAKLGATPEERLAKVPKGVQQDLWEAAELLYLDEGTKKSRDKSYSSHMKKLSVQYPDNHEVAAFYALSILGAVPVGRDETAYGKGAKVAQSIIEENPNHPGALHYLIHSYDDPGHAKFALNAANSYAKVALDAAHALHMPSHIYVALGMWDKVVSSNIASWEASVKRMKREKLDIDAQSYHAWHWLMYGYLQQGEFETAKKMMEEMNGYTQEDSPKQMRNYLIAMKGTYLVETGNWNSEITEYNTSIDDLNISGRAIQYFCLGKKAALDKNLDSLMLVIKMMEEERLSAKNLVTETGLAMCSSVSIKNAPNQLDIDKAQVMEMELRALAAELQNKTADTEKWLKMATELVESISFSYGPPPIVYPAHEMYAEWLMMQNRAADAVVQFDKSLERGTKRRKALMGKIKALESLGKEKEAQEIKALLVKQQEQLSVND